MMRKISDNEFGHVVQLPSDLRYEYFVKRVVDERRAWGLMVRDEWVVQRGPAGEPALPLWPDLRFAMLCADSSEAPSPLRVSWSLDAVLSSTEVLPKLVVIFPTPDNVGPTMLRATLEEAIRSRMVGLGQQMIMRSQEEGREGEIQRRLRRNRVRRASPHLRRLVHEALDIPVAGVRALSFKETEDLRQEFRRSMSRDEDFYRFSWLTEEGSALWLTLARGADVLLPDDVVLLPLDAEDTPAVMIPTRTALRRVEALFAALGGNGVRLWAPDGSAGLDLRYSPEEWGHEYRVLASGPFAVALLAGAQE